MLYFDWSPEKNEWLKAERDVCFEDVQLAFEGGRVLAVYAHPNQRRYPGQQMLVVEIRRYGYLVPFVQDSEKIFLKTIIPNRVATEKYIIKRKQRII